MLERAQLLEVLARLERSPRQLRQAQQRADAVCVEPAVPAGTAHIALAAETGLRAIAIPRDRRTAEVESQTARVGNYLYDVGIHELIERDDRCRESRDLRLRMLDEQTRNLRNDRRRHERLIALQVHHDVGCGPAAYARNLCDSIGARRMVTCGADGRRTETPRDTRDSFVVGRDQNFVCTRSAGRSEEHTSELQ